MMLQEGWKQEVSPGQIFFFPGRSFTKFYFSFLFLNFLHPSHPSASVTPNRTLDKVEKNSVTRGQ